MVCLAIALLDLPYGYYVFLRFLVCAVCAYLASWEARSEHRKWAWVLAGVATLYNPFMPIHLNRDLWAVINLSTIWVLAVHMCLRGPAYARS